MRCMNKNSPAPTPHIVDLATVMPAELDPLWQPDVHAWRDQLLWDISGVFATFRRVLAHGGVQGKAVRVGTQTVGYAYYGIRDGLGMIAGLTVAAAWRRTAAATLLVQETMAAIRRQGVRRIESHIMSFDEAWLPPLFAQEGCRTYWREFLRREIPPSPEAVRPVAREHLEPWRGSHLHAAARIMQAAYVGAVDAEANVLYRNTVSCRAVLENILNQPSHGVLVTDASALALHRGQQSGFTLITEIAPRQAHLAQVAVMPTQQRQGIGRRLLTYGINRLAEREFDTLSLTVSRANHRAVSLYHTMGFQPVLSFPVFVWER